MYTDYEYFQQIQLLAWKLLIDSHVKSLPIRITPIAKLYNLEKTLDYTKSRWYNTKELSEKILDLFGLNYSSQAKKQLAIRIACPTCIIKECNIEYPEQLVLLCDIPYEEALRRLERYQSLQLRNNFYMSELEIKVKDNLQKSIDNYNNQTIEY